MKSRLISNFLSCILLLFVTCFPVSGLAQTDSTHYHYYKIRQPVHQDDLPNAYAFFERKHKEARDRNDTAAMVYNLHLITGIRYDLGLLHDSEEAAVSLLELLDAQTDTPAPEDDYRRVYNQLGRIYRSLRFNTQSIVYYEKALSLAPAAEDSVVLLNNIANNYRDLSDHENAAAYYQLSYDKSLKPFLPVAYARTLSNMYFQEALNGSLSAKDSLLKAKEMRLALGNTKGLFSSYRQLALVEAGNGNPREAKAYTEEALSVAHAINSAAYLKEALSLFSEISNDLTLQAYAALSDSLERIERYQENTYASMKYNITKEREKTLAGELREAQEKNEKHLFQALGVIVILIAAFLFYVLLQRFKKAKALEVYRTETRISSKVHDEVANDVYRVMTKLQTGSAIQTDILDDLEDIYTKTRDISKESSIIEVRDNFEETLTDLLLGYNATDVNIITRNIHTIQWQLLPDNKKRVIYRVLQELMTNMRKHSKASLAVVSFRESGKKITVEYNDNGVGGTLQKNNGLQNAENRIHAINGSITFEAEPQKGFKVRFTV